ncbi:hypothetical protein G4B88_016439 [Cannabis sativa]|uniref:Glabrous enhancer-binding protein-like DBD domain-containing protein n=1 Tax=Cannabis sativa TaxID=3483 RepID=A0A7J6FHY9_CANSA|nr:hypothetical protein G4B88_016439 [Cannabis sativa]
MGMGFWCGWRLGPMGMGFSAAPRRRNYADGSRWLRSGLATKNSVWQGESSVNPRRNQVVAPLTVGGINDQLMMERNQGENLVGFGQQKNNQDIGNQSKSHTSGEALLREEIVEDEVDKSNDGLLIFDSKRRRTIECQVSGPIQRTVGDVGLANVGSKLHVITEEEVFPCATLSNLDYSSSDHAAIYLEPVLPTVFAPHHRFRFENTWLKEPLCTEIVKDCWEFGHDYSLGGKLNLCAEKLKEWGKEITGNKFEMKDCGGKGKKKSGSSSKTKRVWNEENEMSLMKGLIEYSNKNTNNNTSVNLATDEFKTFLMESFHINVTKKQLSDKLSRLKAKFLHSQTLTFSTPHDQKMYELCNIFWNKHNNINNNISCTDFEDKNSDEEKEFGYENHPMKLLLEHYLATHKMDFSDISYESKLKELVTRWKKFKVRECEYLISRGHLEAQILTLKRKSFS